MFVNTNPWNSGKMKEKRLKTHGNILKSSNCFFSKQTYAYTCTPVCQIAGIGQGIHSDSFTWGLPVVDLWGGIPNTLCGHSTHKKCSVGNFSYLLDAYSDFLPTSTCRIEKGERTLQWRNLTNMISVRWSKFTSIVVSVYHQYDGMRIALFLCCFSPPNP